MFEIHPLLILLLGMGTVIGMIVALRLNAFLALITAAILVSLLAPGDPSAKIGRVAEAFGSTAGGIGIVIALAAIIGKAMMASGAADRVVRMFIGALGERQGGTALLSSGFVLSVPVFFDTVLFLLLPLARSMYRRTGRHYLKYLMAVAAGAAVTHTMVPPTPGPLLLAETLGVDLGVLMLVGALVAMPSAAVGLLFAGWLDRRMPLPMRPLAGDNAEEEDLTPPDDLPALFPSLLPIVIPILLISLHTVMTTAGDGAAAVPAAIAILGNPNLALLISAVLALGVYVLRRRPSVSQLAQTVEESLQSAGVIILITAAGGAFGAMLKAAEIGPAIQQMFPSEPGDSDLLLLFLAFGIASLLKVAQGSSTVAMITASAMLAAMLSGNGGLSFHPVYLATAISSGSLVGSWMNDSGYWIFTKMGGLTPVEGLRSWTPLLILLGVTGMATTLLLAVLLPMA